MKKVIVIFATVLLVLVVLGGLGAAYIFLGSQDRGGAPPASVRNAPEAPKYDASKSKPSTEKLPDYQLPTEFKLPTELDIGTPQIPEGLSTPASGPKT